MSIPKVLGLSIVGIIIAVGAYLVIPYQIQEQERLDEVNQRLDNSPTFQDRLDAMTFEDCKKVDHNSQKELQEKCMQINGVYP